MEKISRNDPCPCGSGERYKHCCSQHDRTFVAEPPTDPISNSLQSALAYYQAGRLPQAKTTCQEILQVAPNNPYALHLSGVIAMQEGRNEIAIELIRKAITFKPDYAEAHNNMGILLNALGKHGDAAASFNKAITCNPNYVMAHYNLGNVLKTQGKLDEAVASFNKALILKPDYAEALNNLGSVLREQGKLDEAAASYFKAITLKQNYAEAHNNLGAALNEQGKLDEAATCYYRALTFKPSFAEAHYNLGTVFKEQGKLDMAVESYCRALSLKPDYADAHYNLGNALQAQGNLDKAGKHFIRAITLKPDYAESHNNLGLVLKDQGKLDAALESYRKALSIKQDFVESYGNLLFLYAYHALLDPHAYLAQACGWEQFSLPAQDRQAAHARTFQRLPLAGRRLRVGYVSGDYWNHAVSCFVEQLFTHHDRAQIELFAYSTHNRRDAATERLQASAEHWVSLVGVPDAEARERIEADGIDVLIDLSGHTGHNRLGIFARRAAPVQAHYLGFFASTGLTEMDYWIGDETLTPAETDSHFSEQVWRLPRVWVSYEGKADAPPPDWQPSQDGIVWLGSFNNLGKLTPATLALWAQVLHALPEGKLLLKTKELADAGNRQRTLDSMASHGISPDRIELQDAGITPDWPAHMAYYDRLDIALDPVGGVGGGTTTCDALWMGLPVITLEGDRMASRMTASMLNATGHPEWIARSEAEYIAKVVALARDVERRKALRSAQRDQMAHSPLCDAQGLARDLEQACFEMFGRWLEKQSEQPSAVS